MKTNHISNLFSSVKSTLFPNRIALSIFFTPWCILLAIFTLRLSPQTWEFSDFSPLKRQPISWRVLYCTNDTVGNDGKVYSPNQKSFILYGGARKSPEISSKLVNSSGESVLPASYCSFEDISHLPLPDSLRVVWGRDGKFHDSWVTVRPHLQPTKGVFRKYQFALLSNTDGRIELIVDSTAISQIIKYLNIGFGALPPSNEDHSRASVW